MWNLLLMPLHYAVLKGGMRTPRERYSHIGSATDKRPTSSCCAPDRSGLPLTMCKGQGIAFQQVMQELHAILLLMQVLPILKQRPPCRQICNQLLSLRGTLAWVGEDRANGTFKFGGTPEGAVWPM